MKKLVFMLVAFAAISFASCGNKTDNNAATTDSDSVTTVNDSLNDSTATNSTVATDSVKGDSVQTPAA
ncbi:hypothetical protein HMPREF9332_00449 [Alloprevotella rava F0323]|uniref:Entericidin n=1 Tax=Alloprevotella rava F0323 TaxID=679199 RepID=G5GA48_9BACT|nr:hypothetical protein [Alloprevotella rava]EHG24248.1 hypothetical protein HMPREF9332_00449 [Alloprevotella rava F0323]